MNDMINLELLPLGKTLSIERGGSLQDALFAEGVEFPCGGRGRCKGCRIRVLTGSAPPTADDERLIGPAEFAEGWRLDCRVVPVQNLKVERAQWEAAILADDTTFAFVPADGLGVAVDLGTTTVVAQLLDLRTGHVLAVRTALNVQARHGADIMSRIDFALAEGGQRTLETLIREQIGGLVQALLATIPGREADLKHVVVVGNTVMHHLFCGVSVEPLSHHPFDSGEDGLQIFEVEDLKWVLSGSPSVRFLPCLGGFVGSDILAGILATKLHERDDLSVLVDLGTNGEIVVGNRHRMLCASTAAGPAFEGARISMGMRASTGAISEVSVRDGHLHCHVLGNQTARGICGSGLVDAVAGGLDLGSVQASGRLALGAPLSLAPPVVVTQGDVRELQLAKGAIAAGIQLLLEQWGSGRDQVERVYLAGAFGNYISRASARRIGLIDFPVEKVQPAGNTALLGAKLVLFGLGDHDGRFGDLVARVGHVSLNDDPRFHEVYVDMMGFPPSA